MMSPIENERHAAVFELLGAVTGLIDQNVVPDYMKDFLRSRADRLRKAYSITQQRKESADA